LRRKRREAAEHVEGRNKRKGTGGAEGFVEISQEKSKGQNREWGMRWIRAMHQFPSVRLTSGEEGIKGEKWYSMWPKEKVQEAFVKKLGV